MISVVYDNQEYLKQWASQNLGYINFEPAQAIGFVKDNKLICVVVYNNYRDAPIKKIPISIEISIYSIDKSWCNRHSLYVISAYPFIQLKVKRVQATVAKNNKHTRTFLEKSGFKLEGCQRKGWVFGGDAMVYSMLKSECRWLKCH